MIDKELEKKIQAVREVNKKLLSRFDEVCKKNEIEYFLDAGILLGAVRHQGFIPWDDDVDVVMTRDNFEKLLRVPQDEWGKDMELVTYDSFGDTFLDFYHRLVYLKDVVPVNTFDKLGDRCQKYKNKISLDIVILDYAYKNKIKQKLLVFKLYSIYAQAMGHRPWLDYSGYSPAQAFFIRVMAFWGRRRKLEKIFFAYEKNSSNVKKGDFYFHSNGLLKYLHFIYRVEWYCSICQVKIEETKYPAPIGKEAVLNTLYGDYKKLPPEKDRFPEHIK